MGCSFGELVLEVSHLPLATWARLLLDVGKAHLGALIAIVVHNSSGLLHPREFISRRPRVWLRLVHEEDGVGYSHGARLR